MDAKLLTSQEGGVGLLLEESVESRTTAYQERLKSKKYITKAALQNWATTHVRNSRKANELFPSSEIKIFKPTKARPCPCPEQNPPAKDLWIYLAIVNLPIL